MPGTRHFPFNQAASVVRALWIAAAAAVPLHAAEPPADFAKDIRPILEANCFECHADGAKKGSVAFDEHGSDAALVADKALWFRVLKNVRNGLMPPPDKKQPAAEQKQALQKWIKAGALQLDPAKPDPGRPVLRRLNRTEYRNTIRALTGVEFRVDEEFPADDTGDGFDNLGEVLSISPLLLEKYLAAAKSIVQRAVPPAAKAMPEEKIGGNRFHRMIPKDGGVEKGPEMNTVTFYEPRTLTAEVNVKHAGQYTLTFDLSGREKYVEGEVDLNRCRVKFKADGEELGQNEYRHAGGRNFRYDFARDWKEGRHEITVEAEPLTPNEKQVRSLGMEVNFVLLKGPTDPQHWTKSENYDRWFPREVPADAEPRRAYAKELLGKFATRAFRRPADDGTVDRLTKLAESIWSQPGQTFEMGVGRAMEAVLASPRFLFLEEFTESAPDGGYPFVDDYSLASRLSYFLWSTLPDEELLRLAAEKKLRPQLAVQFQRMLADSKTQEFFRNFTGQWLQGRDIEGIPIDARFVLIREQKPDPEQEQARRRFFELRRREASQLTDEEKAEMEKVRAVFRKNQDRFKGAEFSGDLRRDMRRETEMFFEYIIRENRPLTELINADYTFLNRRLAEHYGVPGIEGNDLRKVTLPPDSPRGGILTQGTVLAVTSNPTRTSPVKRGLFILDNILGTPPPPAPPNVPDLEEARKEFKDREPKLSEMLALHRANALCSSCHQRMDPLGLALENFNAMGNWRETEANQPIEPAGRLITGEAFADIRELKHVLATDRKMDFYRCITEKMLIYALGRGLEAYDIQTVDTIVDRIVRDGGKMTSLLSGIVESVPFQKQRATPSVATLTLNQE